MKSLQGKKNLSSLMSGKSRETIYSDAHNKRKQVLPFCQFDTAKKLLHTFFHTHAHTHIHTDY